MNVVSTKLKRAPRRTSRSRHLTYAVGATTLAVATMVTAGSISTTEAAHAEHQVISPVQGPIKRVAVTAAASTAPKPAPKPAAKPVAKPAPAPAPIIAPPPPPAPVYANNLDGWIRQSLDIMRANGIPGSYDGIYRNVMRESTGNPRAINLYDSNAAAGIPSKGLLQVIDPTFAAYHVAGTKFDVWDPVANIVAACNYAAHNYGSMDNVNSAY